MGNDVNDLECLSWVGMAIAVADAVPEVRRVAQLVTARPGGFGAVREAIDWLIEAQADQPTTTGKVMRDGKTEGNESVADIVRSTHL